RRIREHERRGRIAGRQRQPEQAALAVDLEVADREEQRVLSVGRVVDANLSGEPLRVEDAPARVEGERGGEVETGLDGRCGDRGEGERREQQGGCESKRS